MCTQNFKMMVTVMQKGMIGCPVTGVIGFDHQKDVYSTNHFMTQLKKDGLIDHNIFSMDVSTYTKTHLMIGGYDADKYALTDLHWNDVTN